jgi:RNA polymerase sigma-70 factor (ECF subfamily)
MRALALAPAENPAGAVRPPEAAADLEGLLPACREGDRAAFARLFEACKDRVYALALHLSNDPFEAGDVTQEVFLKLLTRVSQFREEARFTTWLHRVVVNTWRIAPGPARARAFEHPDGPPASTCPARSRGGAAERRRRVGRSARVRESSARSPAAVRPGSATAIAESAASPNCRPRLAACADRPRLDEREASDAPRAAFSVPRPLVDRSSTGSVRAIRRGAAIRRCPRRATSLADAERATLPRRRARRHRRPRRPASAVSTPP